MQVRVKLDSTEGGSPSEEELCSLMVPEHANA